MRRTINLYEHTEAGLSGTALMRLDCLALLTVMQTCVNHPLAQCLNTERAVKRIGMVFKQMLVSQCRAIIFILLTPNQLNGKVFNFISYFIVGRLVASLGDQCIISALAVGT